jgi:hypothetical protein
MKLAQLGILVVTVVALYVTSPVRGAQFVEAASAQADSAPAAAQNLDFEFFKTRVEPIFLNARSGHARCYRCHQVSRKNEYLSVEGAKDFRLERLSPGSTSWTEEQSRRNFEVVSQLVTPGDPLKSRLLMHPLAPEVGGGPQHGGGKQFKSQDNPDWLIMAQWVSGQTADRQ